MKQVLKENISIVIIGIIAAIAIIAAPFICGPSQTVPKVLADTWKSEEITLTFSGWDEVKVEYGDVVIEGTYTNGTTGQNFVIWMDLGDCPEELEFFEGDRENYLIYSEGEDGNGKYMEIDGVKYYKQ